MCDSVLRGYGEKSMAYYIRCTDCQTLFAQDPAAKASWEEEVKETEEKLRALIMANDETPIEVQD